jgi:hypothetical protein
MKRSSLRAALVLLCLGLLGQPAMADDAKGLSVEIQALRQQMNEMQKNYEARLQELQRRLDTLPAGQPKAAEPGGQLEKLVAEASAPSSETPASSEGGALQSFNPDIAVVVDTFYHHDNTSGGIDSAYSRIRGFNSPSPETKLENGFNLRHLEVNLSAEVDPYFKAWAIVAAREEAAELEEAVIQTTCLPYGFQLKAGKFFSDLGRLNSQHSHAWDFTDQPLVYRLLLGDHNLNDKGAQISWLAPTSFHLLAGLEAFQGDNPSSFNYLDEAGLPQKDGPRVWVGWLKYAPNLPARHGLQLGVSVASGVHQMSLDPSGSGADTQWLSGRSTLYGLDAVYKYSAGSSHGQGDFILQGEYLIRRSELDVARDDQDSSLVGMSRNGWQDGYYLQAVYGFLPRWRLALRWDQVGLNNHLDLPEGGNVDYSDSRRLTAMVDFSPTEFSRIRLQAARGEYDTGQVETEAWEFFLQLMVTFGTHGAHKF